jgi:YYY domain-containing protein
MIEIEHLLFVCAWLIVYLVLQLCTWLILRPWLSPTLALPASFGASLLCSCLISWYLTWLGFPPELTLGVYFILTGIVLAEVQRARVDILSDLMNGKWYYALFFLVFATMLVARMFYPDIDYRSEKFMDHAFLASIMRTPIVPPLDPWISDQTLTIYYYLGHWCFATLGIIAKIPSWFVFQFIIPTVASVSAVQLYGVGKLLLKRFSLLPVACLFIMNPFFVYDYINGVGIPALLWRSSRVVPDTITEYPGFTFLCGDVHATGMTVFNQCFFILICVYLFSQWKKINHFERGFCTILTGISLGTMVGLHSWDTLFYGMIFCFAAVIIWYQSHTEHEHAEHDREGSGDVRRWIIMWCTHLYTDIVGLFREKTDISDSRAAILYLWILVPVISLLSYAPFLLMMTPYGFQGFGFVHTKTTVTEFLLMFGWFVLLHLCTLVPEIKKQPTLLFIAVPFVVTGYSLIGILLTLLAYLMVKQKKAPDILVGSGLFLILLGELVYVMDFLSGRPGYRTNTIFRLYIAAWLLFGVGSLCNIGIHIEQLMNRVSFDGKKRIFEKVIPVAVIIVVLLSILAAPLIAWKTNAESYDSLQDLDGFAWLKRNYPDDYAAIEYLWGLPGKYILIEQEGGDYSYSARISTATGMSAVLGWTFHELGWRGANPPGWHGERTSDVRAIYHEPERAIEIMEKYNADFLILGALEREWYKVPDDLAEYPSDLIPVFTAGETTIYQRAQK